MSGAIVPGSELNFEQDVLEHEQPVILWFRAQWCGPCRATSDTIDSLCDAYDSIRVIAIDVDELPEIPVNYGVKALPSVLLMQAGDVLERVSGAAQRHRFQELFERAATLD